jgi:hypothetical protein
MMKRTAIALLIVLSATLFANGQQIDPDQIKNSLVRVVVTINERESKVLTGFVWKTPNQVVTSLHGMSKTGTIKVLFMNQAWRNVRIKKILQKADLVMLEVLPGQDPVPIGVAPINNFHVGTIRLGADVFAFGFNSGATGSSSRILRKGDVKPETLFDLLPSKDKNALAKIGFPALDLNILYLEGSLLPGFSGAPVFDSQGRLIGVGDGGLEKGASNVSWIIPAKYITELENSTVSSLPPNFETLSQLFSADVRIETTAENTENVEQELLKQNFAEPVETDEFEFYPTKNRSLMEMVDTSDDPENLMKFADELEEDIKITLDYEGMRFNIFEDINNGVVLAVPVEQELIYSNQEEAFQVVSQIDDGMNIYHIGMKDDFSETDFDELLLTVGELINTNFAERYGLSGFTIDEEYSYTLDFGPDRKIAWVLSAANEGITGQDGLTYVVYVYMTVLMSSEKTFMSVATIPIPAEFIVLTATLGGLDCNNPGMYAQQCEYMAKVFKTFSATHLTTFAY